MDAPLYRPRLWSWLRNNYRARGIFNASCWKTESWEPYVRYKHFMHVGMHVRNMSYIICRAGLFDRSKSWQRVTAGHGVMPVSPRCTFLVAPLFCQPCQSCSASALASSVTWWQGTYLRCQVLSDFRFLPSWLVPPGRPATLASTIHWPSTGDGSRTQENSVVGFLST